MTEALRVLVAGALALPAEPAGFAVEAHATLADALVALDGGSDAIVVDAGLAGAAALDVEAIVARAALVVVLVDPDAEHALAWLRRGADDVIAPDELAAAAGRRRIRFAIERHRGARARDPAHSSDVATGLPHRRQLLELMSQLLALREREPSPMAILVLRTELAGSPGAPPDEVDRGALRRKIAVRLRAGVRASDIVATLGDDLFAVLLGSLLAPADAERVAAKIVAAIGAPFTVGGRELAVGVAVGLCQFPQDGKVADKLLRRATALAAAAPLVGALRNDAAGHVRAAANDES